MDLDTAKENILPLRSGRRADLMESALGNEKEMLELERNRFEKEITNYDGKDPLDPWYKYICWIEQSYFKSGNDGGLLEVIQKCIMKFENEKRYKQDRRLIKLFIKYIDTRSNPQELYQQLYNSGVGTMVADLYIAWSYYFDVINDFPNAEAIFQKGIDAGAQPYDELIQAHQVFNASIMKRILYKDDTSKKQFQETMDERRHALTRLNAHKNKYVGSIRTGIAVKNENPGKFVVDENQSTSNFQKIAVHQDTEVASKFDSISLVGKSILETAKTNENIHEPGPWTKAKIKGKSVFTSAIVETTSTNFNILEDDTIYEPVPCPRKLYEKGICLPPDFISKNKPQKSWEVPIVIEEPQTANSIPKYDKFLAYPLHGVEISLEEIRGYKWFKTHHKTSPLTKQYDLILSNNFENGCRIIPGFVNKNVEQSKVNYLLTKENVDGVFMFKINEMITDSGEMSIEELLARKFYRGEIKLVTIDDFEEINENDDMEITQIGDRRQSVYPLSRMSIIPRKSILRKSVFQPVIAEDEEDDVTKTENRHRVRFENPLQEMREEDEVEHNKEADGSNNSITKKRKLNDDVDKVNALQNNIKSEDDSDDEEATLKVAINSSVLNAQKAEFFDKNSPQIDNNSELFKPPMEKKHFKPFDLTEDDANDTCSTVQFNLFIKQQSVSTPIAKKTVPKLVPLANQESAMTQSNAFTIYTDDPKNEDLNNKNEAQEQVNENSGVCVSMMQANVLQPKLSTIMEVTETTQSTKSNVSCINDAENHALKTQTKNTPPESDKHFNNLSVFRIPEDQTETVPFNILKLAQIPKTPGRLFGNCIEDSAIKQKQHLNDEKQQQSFMTIPKFDSSFSGDTSVNNFSLIKLPQIVQEKEEISHVEIPATQEWAIENEKSHTTVPVIQQFVEEKHDLELERATSQLILDKSTNDNDEEHKISHVEIPATQIELSQADIPVTQDPISLNKLVEKQEGFKFDIYEDTSDCKTIPLVRLQPQNVKLDETKNFHASRKENYVDSFIKRNVSDEFLNLCSKSPSIISKTINCPEKEVSDLLKFSDIKVNKTLENSFQSLAIEPTAKSASPTMNIFEEDLNTQKFSMLLTSDKNSTILDSICKKQQANEEIKAKNPLDISIEMDVTETTRLNTMNPDAVFKVPQIPVGKSATVKSNQNNFEIFEDEEEEDDDMSKTIYYNEDEKKYVEHNTNDGIHSWEDEKICSFIFDSENRYEHTMIQDNVTTKLREAIVSSKGNPFCRNIRNLILEHCDFEVYLAEHVSNCTMLKNIPRLKTGVSFESGGQNFKVMKFIAKGTYGSVWCVKEQKSGEHFAAKQEKPANMYEYFICLELADRLRGKNVHHMLKAFMQIHYAVIANNASIFITDLSPYGTLIDVCNKIKHVTGRNVDEYIGMIFTSQLLSIIDFLHSCHIIHADLKPDNLILMSKVEIGMKVPAIQLIDFGSAIDMESYLKDDVFNYVVETENFTCCEMKENKPWTYQTDLFGLCGTAHVILFGKYMNVEKKLLNWEPTTKFPRYFQKPLWDVFFNTLLNVPDCNSMPNLQHLKRNFDVEIMERQKFVNEKIAVFNNALMS